ncbi:GGDEF domain-containing protein [Acinetobacter sp. YH12131]|uniref:GGDEF domain-containing protein n=1 Tax=Acinetobacter sp. YH12131 TaxID=2601115 RepID=UPI0015D11F79|nr:GGDEF domain-containing protein [Acinetobacter sp. YH12131]
MPWSLYVISYRIPENQTTLYYFPILCLGFYSSSLMSIGYFLGQMTVLTGVFTIGSIFTGLLLFKRSIIFWGTIPCLVVFYGGSLLTLRNIIPYAPVFQPYTFTSAEFQNFMLINNLIGSTIIGVLLAILFNTFLGRWMIREEHQQQLILLDPLTQTLNRRGLSIKFNQLVNQKQLAGQNKEHICLALLDLDWFKQVNDRYGHDGGDQVLKQIPKILQKNLRSEDIIGRFGGEEFMIIFSNTSPQIAQNVLERCRIAIEQHRIAYAEHEIQITASFGLSALYIYHTDQHELIQRTDAALYKAKQSGRNNVQQDIES